MKMRLLSLILVMLLAVTAMTGCQVAKTAGRSLERGVESVGDSLKNSSESTAATASGKHKAPVLSLEEAQSIALKHAGLTVDQVTALHTEYEIEYGIGQYDVEFRHGAWEYDYEIHADTGEIISFSKDD